MNQPCHTQFPSCPSRNRIRKAVCDCFCFDAEFGPKIASLSECLACPRAGTEVPVETVQSFLPQPSDCDCSTPSLHPENVFDPENLPPGVGTTLHHIFADLGVPACEQCYALVVKMNEWGPAKCRIQMKEIVADILPRARNWVNANLPIVPGFLAQSGLTEAILTHAIRLYVYKAIRKYEREIK